MKKQILVLFLLLLTSTGLLAETLIHESGFSFWSPQDWVQSSDREEVVTIESADETAVIEFEVKSLEQAEELTDDAFAILNYMFSEGYEIASEAQTTVINGLTTIVADGSGDMDGKDVRWAFQIVSYSDKIVFVMALCEMQTLEEHGPNIERVLNSVK